jgi:hypothetical protein
VLAYADRDRASRLLADHRAVLHALYDLVDRRHGADGETVARLVVREDTRVVDELELRDRFRRDLDADRAISLVEDLRYHAGERELVTDGGEEVDEELDRTRVGHCKADATDVYVGRSRGGWSMKDREIGARGWLGNPHAMEDGYSRTEAISLFRDDFEARLRGDEEFRDAVRGLAGETLGCWCQRLDEDEPACHAEVIAEWADRLARDDETELVTDGGRVRSEEEIDYPDMPVPAVDAALHSAHAIVTSPVYAHTFPDGEVNEDYPIKEGGWWDQFTTCLDGRWEAIKAQAETFDDREADRQTRLVTDGGSEKHTDDFGRRDDLARVADALELQNALLLQLVQDQERERCRQRHDPDDTGRSDRATATDVVDAYGDLYGGSVAGWEFDPVSDRIENMGDSP